jgi:hypothetical protein
VRVDDAPDEVLAWEHWLGAVFIEGPWKFASSLDSVAFDGRNLFLCCFYILLDLEPLSSFFSKGLIDAIFQKDRLR